MKKLLILLTLGLFSLNSFAEEEPSEVGDPSLFACVGTKIEDSMYLVFFPHNTGFMFWNSDGVFLGKQKFSRGKTNSGESYLYGTVGQMWIAFQAIDEQNWVVTLVYPDESKDELLCR